MDLIAGLEFDATLAPVHLVAQAIANDPKSAIRARFGRLGLVGTIVKQPVLAGLPRVRHVGVLPRNGPAELVRFVEREVVAARWTIGTVHVHGAPDVRARLLQRDLILIRLALHHHHPPGAFALCWGGGLTP